MLPGTTESLVIPALESVSGLGAGKDFAVWYNPEFIREGGAVADFLQPPYTIRARVSPVPCTTARTLPGDAPTVETAIGVAEMVKYASNTFHSLQVGFANELGTLCKNLGVDTDAVTRIFTSDTKLNISSAYLSPGLAFGGSCLPKDLRALTYRAKELDLKLPLLDAIAISNTELVNRAFDGILLTGKRNTSLPGLKLQRR